ncbi:MAG: cyclic nucleotide-binding domain-containing protein [Elusimicrobia bacterium]|nr:cyclic nucleotide-binding domain-containing protein [Elusimicrobiota bacterium]
MVPRERLSSFPVFEHLPAGALDRLAESITEELHPQGSILFKEGDEGDAVFFVIRGEVLIRKILDKQKATYKILSRVSPGGYFGEMALLEKAPRSASALAVSDVALMKLPSSDFRRLLEGDPQSALQLFRGLVITLSARLRQTSIEMVAFFEVGRALAQGLDTKSLARHVLSVVKQSLGDELFGALYYWNEFSAEYEPMAFEGEWPESLKQGRGQGDPLFHWLLQKKECVLSKDWLTDDQFPDEMRAAWPHFRSMLAAPLIGTKGCIGFTIFGYGKQINMLTSGHRQMLAGISNLIAPAFENAAMREEIESKRRLDRAKAAPF